MNPIEDIKDILEKFYRCCDSIATIGHSHYALGFNFTHLMSQLSQRANEIPAGDVHNIRQHCVNLSIEGPAFYMSGYFNQYFETDLSANHPLLGDLNDFADEINLHWDHDNGLNLTAATIRRYTQIEEENTATLINTPSNTPRLFGQAPLTLELDDIELDDIELENLNSDDFGSDNESVDSYIKFHP